MAGVLAERDRPLVYMEDVGRHNAGRTRSGRAGLFHEQPAGA